MNYIVQDKEYECREYIHGSLLVRELHPVRVSEQEREFSEHMTDICLEILRLQDDNALIKTKDGKS